MPEKIGRELSQLLEDAIASLPNIEDKCVASATLNFIRAYETDVSDYQSRRNLEEVNNLKIRANHCIGENLPSNLNKR